MDLSFIVNKFDNPQCIDNRDILCYQRDFYEGLYDALVAAEMLGISTQLKIVKTKYIEINSRIKHLNQLAHLVRRGQILK